jgi:homoserine kinase
VAAAVLGGLVVSCQGENGSVNCIGSRFDPAVAIVLVIPEVQLSTEAARAALPATYSRADAIFNLQRVALLVAALKDGRMDLLSEAMRDRLHQPYRAPLIPGFEDAMKLGGKPGLLGVALSGAGPSVLVFCRQDSVSAGDLVADCFRKRQIRAEARRLAVDNEGLVVTRVE